ncbi:MAG: hypothetical protein GX223_07310 [Tepidanaerobacter sp.]|nr:hypothetical protein [Tepidanaerobacter sp.]HQE05584.1 hypothetical protein [Tepidanaerobacteraceae bacterium]
MSSFKKLTPTNGFDNNNLNNARQNNYAWSMSELGDYIYVGTSRNMLINIISAISPNVRIPSLLMANPVENQGEIWRYRKDGKLPWQRVYRSTSTPGNSVLSGFRYLITHRPFGGSPAIYAAEAGDRVRVLKSTNGVNWRVLEDTILQGSSSRAMVTHRGKLYIATRDELEENPVPLLYSSEDPEFYPWEPVITNVQGFDPDKNPRGSIWNMAVFNNRIYISTSYEDRIQVWRTNDEEPRLNDWTLVVDGFENPLNTSTLAMGVFKNHLYVSGTKPLPLAWLIPFGFDLIRIDKDDNWETIVGGNPLILFDTIIDKDSDCLSNLGSGFNNPFNVYGWQIQEYKDKLLISTFDDSSNMEVILTTLLENRAALENLIGETATNILIAAYRAVVEILTAIRYPRGFDLYISEDGVNFSSVFLDGLGNPHNYGGRILFVDSKNDLYLGTANPFDGCEVWRTDNIPTEALQPCGDNHYEGLLKIKEMLSENFKVINDNMPVILELMSKNAYLKSM